MPTIYEWKCPDCGSTDLECHATCTHGNGHWESVPCPEAICPHCGFVGKMGNVKRCPTCKGSGTVPETPEKKTTA